MKSLRSLLYSWARLLGDINSILRGPGAMGKRVIRKGAYRKGASWLGKLFR